MGNGVKKAALELHCVEGLEAFQRFDATVRALLAVPHSTLAHRERAYRTKVDANPYRRGPK